MSAKKIKQNFYRCTMCFFLSSNFIPRVRHTLKSPCVADWKFCFLFTILESAKHLVMRESSRGNFTIYLKTFLVLFTAHSSERVSV